MGTSTGDAWLGVDLGTSGVRALVADADGHVLGSGTAPLVSHRDGERHEQDAAAWWPAVREAIGKARADGADLAAVRAVAVAGTSGTVTLVDRASLPVMPALMYDDGRAAAEAGRVNEAGAEQWARAGYRSMQRSWALPKLLWLLKHCPDPAATGWRLAHQTDVVNARLVGSAVPTDTSNALKTGADSARVAWPSHLMAALDVPCAILPDLVLPGTVIGSVCTEAAEATGLSEGTAVVAGMTDGCAAQLGAGAVATGDWNAELGTTLVVKGVTDSLLRDPNGVVYSHRAPTGQWLPGGASSTGAGAIRREFVDTDLDRLTAEAADLLPTTHLRYPLVSPGERFPFVAPAAEGFSTRAPSGEAEAFAAVLQGVAYVERLCFDYLDLLGAPLDGTLTLTGGATRNPLWNQLRADVLQRPVRLVRNAQPALGMAILAASAVTGEDLPTLVAGMVHEERTLEPRSGAAHRENYLRFVGELEDRGWLPEDVAAHAVRRAGAAP